MFEGREFGVEVIDDVFGVEGSKRWRVILFVVVGGGHRGGAGGSESVSVFHSCFFLLCFEGDDFCSKQDGVSFYKSSEWRWHESGFVRVPGIVSGGRSLPFDEVNIASSLSFVRDYRFHFVFMFSFDKVRWRTRVIGSMDIVFVIWR